jgi:DNA mismatch repair protein MutS
MTTVQPAEQGIYEEYFRLTQDYKTKYGAKTILLMQVGAFFEVYGLKRPATGDVYGSSIMELSEICQLNVSEKKSSYDNSQILMAGFRDYTIDKYIAKLVEFGYTLPVFIQEKVGKVVKRVFDQVYSPGTIISCETDAQSNMTNNIMCIWMELHKPFGKTSPVMQSNTRESIVYGVSVVNIFTGKSSIFQYEAPFFMNTTTFDELERYLSVYSPSELILISPFEGDDLHRVVQYSGIKTGAIHKICTKNNKDKVLTKKLKRCSEQTYVKQLISSFYAEETYNICTEFQRDTIATQSFCYLLNFIQEHNPNLVKRISIPDFDNTSTRMILANHTLSQLNIIDDAITSSKQYGNVSSVLSLLNKCCTPMGRRKFQYQLTNPTFNEEWLNSEYIMTAMFLVDEQSHYIDAFRKLLGKVRDTEKLCRQLVSNKIYPSSLYHLYESVNIIQQLNMCLYENPEICQYLCSDFFEKQDIGQSFTYMNDICTNITDFLRRNLILDVCATTTSMSVFPNNIIAPGISSEIDTILRKHKSSIAEFEEIREYMNDLMRQHEKSSDTEYVKIHETEKSGVSLQITTKRATALKMYMMKQEKCLPYPSPPMPPTQNVNTLQENVGDVSAATFGIGAGSERGQFVSISDLRFVKTSSSITTIESDRLVTLSRDILNSKDELNCAITKVYLDIIAKFVSELFIELEHVSKYVAKLDVIICKAHIAKQYKYCVPTIDSCASKSYVNVRELRHCLIEHIQHNELYVANDVSIGMDDDINGFLLYGTNAVGKTSFIRALGISVIMAQSGLYVPCSQFVYKPYTAIFSRILGNDNIFKGLSTFAVEMSELRIILKMSNENSLVLGDELCSGTEMESALSIFVAGLMELNKKNCSYIFATHFHEVTGYSEVTEMPKLGLKHMEVTYNRELDCLVYNRVLKDGSGPRIYGLEVCKSLHLGEEFLETAYAIRNKYYPENRGELSNEPSVYNRKKVRGKCEICNNNIGEETHHLKQQKDADKNGFIGSIHKNHPANLLTVCEKCHDKIHSPNNSAEAKKAPKRTKTTAGYKLL